MQLVFHKELMSKLNEWLECIQWDIIQVFKRMWQLQAALTETKNQVRLSILKGKMQNRVGRFIFPHFKIYYKATVT